MTITQDINKDDLPTLLERYDSAQHKLYMYGRRIFGWYDDKYIYTVDSDTKEFRIVLNNSNKR